MKRFAESRARILRAQSKVLQRLHRATQQEGELLRLRDVNALEKVLQEKAKSLEVLSRVSERLQKLQSSARASAANFSSGENNPKINADLARMARLAAEIRSMNIENQKMIQASRSFFHQYFAGLQEYRARAFGYTRNARSDARQGRNIYINELR